MIKFDDVFLSFNGQKVLNSLSLEIGRGDKVVVLGKSGLGKSSLFSLILGFISAQKGKVFFDGVSVDGKSVWDVRRRVAFVDQDVSIGSGSVADWLHYVSNLKANASSGFQNEKTEKLLDYFELDNGMLEKNVGNLSGGERQRVAIVISILLERSVYLLDEVTSALDDDLKEKVMRYFVKRGNWTVVVISHDFVWRKDPSIKVFDLGVGKWER